MPILRASASLYLLACTLAGLGFPARVSADVVPNVGFTDNMVLQRGRAAPVWGKAEAGEEVTVTFRGLSQRATARADGKWSLAVETGPAGGPFELTLKGKNTVICKNVMVGEVWLCSGQSNMEKTLSSLGGTNVDSAKVADYPGLRLLNMRGSKLWKVCTPSIGPDFPATAYYFGKLLQTTLRVPVGVIVSAVGGTSVERWLDPASLAADPILSHDDSAKGDLYVEHILPLVPYGIRGFAWYQGETNTSAELFPHYRDRFGALIKGWRKEWGAGDLPFHFVQVANYRGSAPFDNYPPVREAQRLALTLPHTAMAVTIDIGEEDNVHPKNKWDVGKRLALPALALLYGKPDLVYSGPLYDTGFARGRTLRLRFRFAETGLQAKGGGRVAGFEIAGADTVWHAADAVIAKDTMLLSSVGVGAPRKARYAWRNVPICNLANGAGLPASPFQANVPNEVVVSIPGIPSVTRIPASPSPGADALGRNETAAKPRGRRVLFPLNH